MSTTNPPSPAPSTFPVPRDFVPRVPDDFLTDDELREHAVAQLNLEKMQVNIQARRLAIMQEHKARLEAANAITRNRS